MMSRKQAFSLVEVLIATVVLVVCLLPVLTFSQHGLQEVTASQEDILAHRLLMDMCERYRTSSIDEIATAAADPAALQRDNLLFPLAKLREIAAAEGFDPARHAGEQHHHYNNWRRQYHRRVNLAKNFDGEPGLHKVTFEVTYESKYRGTVTATLTRLIHQH